MPRHNPKIRQFREVRPTLHPLAPTGHSKQLKRLSFATFGPLPVALVQIESPPRDKVLARFIINGEPTDVAFAPHQTLLELVRENLGLTGTKHGCELGECGTCTLLVDGVPVLSCLALAISHRDQRIDTIEGMGQGSRLHPLQAAFADLGAAQCGYCTPGFLMTAKALLEQTPSPTRDEITLALSGNLCRCTGYLKIFEAVELAAGRMQDMKPLDAPPSA